MNSIVTILRLFVAPIVGAVAVALLVRDNCFRVFSIPSDSMAPTLVSGDQIAVTPYRSLWKEKEPAVGDVVVFRRSGEGWFVKRIVGVAGDHLESRNGHLRRNGRTMAEAFLPERRETNLAPEIVPAGCYYVLGDNRGDSVDSRSWGCVGRDELFGKARLVLWSSASMRWNEPARASVEPSSGWRREGRRGVRLFRPVD